MENGISIQEALARIADSEDKPFRLSFVRSTGENAGTIKEVTAYYGAPNPKDRSAPVRKDRSKRKLHVESGTIPLTEVGTRRLLTPMISHIIEFNGKKVFH